MYAQHLRQKAEDLGLRDRVKFVGPRQDVARLLSAADIYCQPNLSPEGFGLTFVEALAAGLPVVTTAMGGALEIVTDRCGVLCPPEVAPIAEALQRLLQDARLRGALGEAGRTRARELCDPQARMDDLARLLRTAANPPGADNGPSTS